MAQVRAGAPDDQPPGALLEACPFTLAELLADNVDLVRLASKLR